MAIDVRTGQAPDKLNRQQFHDRFRERFYDPAFRVEDAAIDRLEEIAWAAYEEGRKAPITQKAGAGYADPDYDLSIEWIETREALNRAEQQQHDPSSPSRVLVIIGSARNDVRALASYPNHGGWRTSFAPS